MLGARVHRLGAVMLAALLCGAAGESPAPVDVCATHLGLADTDLKDQRAYHLYARFAAGADLNQLTRTRTYCETCIFIVLAWPSGHTTVVRMDSSANDLSFIDWGGVDQERHRWGISYYRPSGC